MRLAHVALWASDLDEAAAFWGRYFGGSAGEVYVSRNRPGFRSRFVRLEGVGEIELMTGPWVGPASTGEPVGWDHVAISLGSTEAVDALAARAASDGCLVSGPRVTGDGYYEAVLAMPGGARVEITG